METRREFVERMISMSHEVINSVRGTGKDVVDLLEIQLAQREEDISTNEYRTDIDLVGNLNKDS